MCVCLFLCLPLCCVHEFYNNNNNNDDNNNAVGGRLVAASGDPRETSFLWQRISVLIQRFNAILIGKTSLHPDEAPDL